MGRDGAWHPTTATIYHDPSKYLAREGGESRKVIGGKVEDGEREPEFCRGPDTDGRGREEEDGRRTGTGGGRRRIWTDEEDGDGCGSMFTSSLVIPP